jgi:UDP-N-acetylmuramate: L-alanyl-gamma-D-glutamyl-meso-diaminopimelate ligase
MKIYILGICGTFMAGIALLAREKGHQVLGSDAQVYPPMSTQLEQAGIELREGYSARNLDRDADVYVVGNAISRGNEQLETILDEGLRYVSGPQWLYENVLRERWVLAVAGTHGKTTTSAMLAWILEHAGLRPGFLIGGLTRNFNASARLGDDPFFVIEADEYDTAFCDKRSKFVHYHPRTLILNNLEFDHADIFDDLKAIKRQFHHLLRIVPQSGLVISNAGDANLLDVIGMGCWSQQLCFGQGDADLVLDAASDTVTDAAARQVYDRATAQTGLHNRLNACAALLAARHAGVPLAAGIAAMQAFAGVKRRQEVVADIRGIQILDDFAHHPTAIRLTLQGLKPITTGRLIAVFEPRSNTMKMGVHEHTLAAAFDDADSVLVYDNGSQRWDLGALSAQDPERIQILDRIDEIIRLVVAKARGGDKIVIMSNGGFEGLHHKLIDAMTIE